MKKIILLTYCLKNFNDWIFFKGYYEKKKKFVLREKMYILNLKANLLKGRGAKPRGLRFAEL